MLYYFTMNDKAFYWYSFKWTMVSTSASELFQHGLPRVSSVSLAQTDIQMLLSMRGRELFQHLEVRCFLFFTSYLNLNVFLIIYKTRFHFLACVRFFSGWRNVQPSHTATVTDASTEAEGRWENLRVIISTQVSCFYFTDHIYMWYGDIIRKLFWQCNSRHGERESHRGVISPKGSIGQKQSVKVNDRCLDHQVRTKMSKWMIGAWITRSKPKCQSKWSVPGSPGQKQNVKNEYFFPWDNLV